MINFIKSVSNLLNEKGIEYLIVGGAARLLYKEYLNPSDLDILIFSESENLNKFKQIIKGRINISDFKKGKIIRVIGTPYNIDFHPKLDGLELRYIRSRSNCVYIDKVQINIITEQDLKTNLSTVKEILNGTIPI